MELNSGFLTGVEVLYELIVIGAGPAGITAAIYAARKKMNVLVISKDIGGQVAISSAIENYVGFQFITGEELTRKFEDHVKEFGVELKEGEGVLSIEKTDGSFKVKTDVGSYEAKTVIVASGREPRHLNVPGETGFLGRGLSYCATCDAPFFAGRDVAVIGGGNAGFEAALQLMKIASKVYLIELLPRLRGDPIMLEKIEKSENVAIMTNTRTVEIYGENIVSGIKVVREGREEDLKVQGVFIEIGSIPSSEFIDFVEKNEVGEIVVNERCETSVPGLFAAGDVTCVPEKQIIIAAGEGAKAALAAFNYLSREAPS